MCGLGLRCFRRFRVCVEGFGVSGFRVHGFLVKVRTSECGRVPHVDLRMILEINKAPVLRFGWDFSFKVVGSKFGEEVWGGGVLVFRASGFRAFRL